MEIRPKERRLEQTAKTRRVIDMLVAYQPEPGTAASELISAGIIAQRRTLQAKMQTKGWQGSGTKKTPRERKRSFTLLNR